MKKNTLIMLERLRTAGIRWDDCLALRRIAMTLSRWHELECGDGNDYASWSIERDENGEGPPFMVRHIHRNAGADTVRRTKIPDREKGALARLRAIMAGYPAMGFYVQTDPRGASLYILRAGDIPSGASADSCYSNGIAVYQ